MPICDVCNKEIQFAAGYVLSTYQVATNQSYWEFAFNNQWSYMYHMDREGNMLGMLVQQQAGQRSGWLVCESCSHFFNFDRSKAKQYAINQSDPPDAGPANLNQVGLAAAKAWQKTFGTLPSSIKII